MSHAAYKQRARDEQRMTDIINRANFGKNEEPKYGCFITRATRLYMSPGMAVMFPVDDVALAKVPCEDIEQFLGKVMSSGPPFFGSSGTVYRFGGNFTRKSQERK